MKPCGAVLFGSGAMPMQKVLRGISGRSIVPIIVLYSFGAIGWPFAPKNEKTIATLLPSFGGVSTKGLFEGAASSSRCQSFILMRKRHVKLLYSAKVNSVM